MITDDNAYYSQLTVMPDGTLLANYNQMADSPTNQGLSPRMALYIRRSTDQGATWGRPVRVSEGDLPIVRNSIAVGPDGNTVIAAWDEGYENQTGQGEVTHISTAVSPDGGQTWSSRQTITSPRGPIEQSTIAYGGVGAILAYRSTRSDLLLYRISDDGGRSWSEEREVGGAILRPYGARHHFDRFSMRVDGDGRALLAYVGRDPEAPKQLAVWVNTFDRSGWGTPVRVAAPDGYPEYPRLTVALGNQLHITYFVRDKEFDATSIVLWVVAGSNDAQPIAPVPGRVVALPTATPLEIPAVRVVPAPLLPAAPSPLPPAAAPPLAAIASAPAQRTMLVTVVALFTLVILASLGCRLHRALGG
jgi:hypothetical protein